MRKIGVGTVQVLNRVALIPEVLEILDLKPGDFIIFYENGEDSVAIKKGEIIEASSGCAPS